MGVAVASLVCALAMAVDVFQGIRKWKLWFPNRFFTLNTASITLIGIAMKLPADLNSDRSNLLDIEYYAKAYSIYFLVIMLANFLPSLGHMDDGELVLSMVAWGILVVTITVDVLIQIFSGVLPYDILDIIIVTFPLLSVFSVALTVPASRRLLEHKYKELHRSNFDQEDINFSYEELRKYVIRYWMMAETGNPQFVLACSKVASAFGVICILVLLFEVAMFLPISYDGWHDYYNWLDEASKTDYKWSLILIIGVNLVGIVVGSIAPIFRCLTSISYFSLSIKWSKNHLNVFRVEKHWIQMLQLWKRSHPTSPILGHKCRKAFHILRNMLLNLCIALQVMVVVMCKTICLIPTILLIVLSCCWSICKPLMKIFKREPNASDMDLSSEMEEYKKYVIQIVDDAILSERVLKNTLNSINQLLHVSEKKSPENLMALLRESTGFSGVVEFESEQVPPLTSEETQNSWSLVTVILTAIGVSLPNIAKKHVKGLLDGMNEGLQIVRFVEESLSASDELVKARRAARHVGTEVEVYKKWLQIDLQKKAREGKTSREILQWLGDEAVKIVIEFKSRKKVSIDHSSHKFIAANSMYRITQTLLRQCYNQDPWPTDDELFTQVSRIIADILCACFTNLPRVITMKCHHDAIEKRQDSIRTAAQILGKSKEILDILKLRQLPNLDMDDMAYLGKWHALPNRELLRSQTIVPMQVRNGSYTVTIM